jgi:hypothetical protein
MRHLSIPKVLVRRIPRLVIAVLATGAAVAWADPPVSPTPSTPPAQSSPVNLENLPPGTILPPGIVAAPRTTLPPGSVPAGAPVDDANDYWIISSRRCGGRPSQSNTGCLNYFHRTSDRNLTDVGRDAFFASIRPDQPVCFVVHGSYNRWNDVVTESRKINRWVRSGSPGSAVQVVFFTWPSDGNMPFIFPVDIAMLGRKASQHSFYLANVIGQLPSDQPVCLLGHSHGARSAVAALHLLGGGAIEDGQMLAPGYSTPRLRAVLIAAAIDSNWLNPGQRYSQALQVPEQVLLMRNSRDATLAIYPLRIGRGGRAMGRDGLGRQDRFVMDQMGRKVTELDAAQFAGPNHSFADYHERTELASAIIPYVYFEGDAPAASPTSPGEPVPQASPPATAKKNPPLGDAEPITPAKRAATPEGPTLNGPKLAPAVLTPPSDDDKSPTREKARPAEDGTVKIYPKARSATRGSKNTDASPTAERRESATTKDSPSKPKKKNPFQLRLEP